MAGQDTSIPAPPTDPFGTTTHGTGAAPGPAQPQQQEQPWWAKLGVPGLFDEGGILHPGRAAVNFSSRPERVLTDAQWKTMEANAFSAESRGSGAVYNVYAADADDAMRKLKRRERLNMMQHAGRP